MINNLLKQLSFKERRIRGLDRTGVLFYDPFDTIYFASLPYVGWNQRQVANTATDIVTTTEQVRTPGGTAMRAELNYSAPYNGSWRSELRASKESPLNNWESWTSFSVYFPTDFTNEDLEDVFWQIHASEDANRGGTGDAFSDDGLSPGVSLQIRNGILNAVVIWDAEAINKGLTNTTYIFPLEAVIKGEWLDFVIHVNQRWDNDGFFKVWRHRAGVAPDYTDLIFNYRGPCAYNDLITGYNKLGIYKSSYSNYVAGQGYSTQRVLYYDEYRVGNSLASYQTMHLNGYRQPAVPALPTGETVVYRETFAMLRLASTNARLGWSFIYATDNGNAVSGTATLIATPGAGATQTVGTPHRCNIANGYLQMAQTANKMFVHTAIPLTIDKTTRSLTKLRFYIAHEQAGWRSHPVVKVGSTWYLWDWATPNTSAGMSGSVVWTDLSFTHNGNKWRAITAVVGSAIVVDTSDGVLPAGDIDGVAMYFEKTGTAVSSTLRVDCFEVHTIKN